MELNLKVYLGSYVQLLSLAETPQLSPSLRILGYYTRALLVSQDRRPYYLVLEGLDGVGDLVQGGPVNQLQTLTTVRHSKMCKNKFKEKYPGKIFLNYLRVNKNSLLQIKMGFNEDKDSEIYFNADPDPGCVSLKVEF
jgi:hypothetical protein